jgi:exodeoxyribonuclease VII small subunit
MRMAESKKDRKEIKFEEALKRLEDIVTQLEKSDISLEQSIALFEEGIRLSKFCSQKLNEAEQRIIKLTKTETGELKETPFDMNEDSGLFEKEK